MMDEIKAIKQELEATRLAYGMALQLSQLKGRFLARTAHELRSPLSSLIGLHQLILSDLCESPEEEREFIEQACQAAQKLVGMIDEIVAISKLEYDTISFNKEPFALVSLLDEVYRLTHLQVANRNLRLEIARPAADIYVFTDYQRLLQAFVTLMDASLGILETGYIQLATNSDRVKNFAEITIDLSCPSDKWKQSQTQLTVNGLTPAAIKKLSRTLAISPDMKLLLCQTLFEALGGQLDLLEVFPPNTQKPLTRLACLIPLTTPPTPAQ